MKIGINYLRLKDVKPGMTLTIVDLSDIENHPTKRSAFIHGKNKKQFQMYKFRSMRGNDLPPFYGSAAMLVN